MLIDPRVFIVGPFRMCPQCGKPEFGTLHVGDHRVTRRCRACWHTAGERLPALAKKVVYLDQMILSNMAKTLDPAWRGRRATEDGYWGGVFDALDRAVHLQLIVCPYSRTHERESVVLPHFSVFRRLYEHLALGIEFEWPTRVHQLQLTHAFRQSLEGQMVDYSLIPRAEVIKGDLTAWPDRIQVRVNMPAADPKPDDVRVSRSRSGKAFESFFAQWAADKRPFEEVYRFERRGQADTIMILLQEHLAALQEAQTTGVYTEDLVNYRLEIEVFNALLWCANEAGVSSGEAVGRVVEFLYSEDAFDAPANDISALLMAALARRAVAGQNPPSPGMWNDITTIASYLPYCDAMFLDNQCVELLREGPLNQRIDYPTRLFSHRTRDAFLEYLLALENEAGAAHTSKVVEVYGDAWLQPYRTILAQERTRQAKSKGDST